MFVRVAQHQVLSDEVDVDQAAAPVLEIPDRLAAMLLRHALAHVEHVGTQLQRIARGGQDPAQAHLHMPDQAGIAGDRPGAVGFEVEAEPDAELAEPLARLALDRGLGLLELSPVGMSLETVFVELTTREASAGAEAAPRPTSDAALGAA